MRRAGRLPPPHNLNSSADNGRRAGAGVRSRVDSNESSLVGPNSAVDRGLVAPSHSSSAAAGRCPRALIDAAQRSLEVGEESVIRPVDRARTRDKHIIGSRLSLIQQDRRRHAAQPTLGAVASHRVADLSAGGETYPDRGDAPRSLRPTCGLQDQTRHNGPAAGDSDTQKIGAGLECYKPTIGRIPERLWPVGGDQRLKRIDAYDPLLVAPPALSGRPPLPSVRGTRGGACEQGCWAGKCASR